MFPDERAHKALWLRKNCCCFSCLYSGSTQCSTETPLKTPSQVVHVVFMFLFCFFLPLCIIGVSYVSIFGAARRHSQRMGRRFVTSTSNESLNSISTQNQIALTVFIMIIVFLICWSPFFVYLMYLVTNHIRVLDEGARNLVLAAYWLAFLNSALNPYIYGVRNPQVRRTVRGLLCSLLSVCRRTESRREVRCCGECMPPFSPRGDLDVPCGTTHPATTSMVLRKQDCTNETNRKESSSLSPQFLVEKTSLQRANTLPTFHHPLPAAKKNRRAFSLVCVAESIVGLSTRRVSSPGYINVVALDEEESSKIFIRTPEIEQYKQQEDVAHGDPDDQSKGTDYEEVRQKSMS